MDWRRHGLTLMTRTIMRMMYAKIDNAMKIWKEYQNWQHATSFLCIVFFVFVRQRLRGHVFAAFSLWRRIVDFYLSRADDSPTLAVKQMREVRRRWEEQALREEAQKQKQLGRQRADQLQKAAHAWRLWTRAIDLEKFQAKEEQLSTELANNIADQIEMAEVIARLSQNLEMARSRWVRTLFSTWALRLKALPIEQASDTNPPSRSTPFGGTDEIPVIK